MSHFILVARNFARALPVLLTIAGVAAAPVTASANNQGPSGGTGQGERGDSPYVTVYSARALGRMSPQALSELARDSNRVKIDGVMSRYNAGLVVRSLMQMRPQTIRLMHRLEIAGSADDRIEIIEGLLAAQTRKFSQNNARLDAMHKKLRSENRLTYDFFPLEAGKQISHEDSEVRAYYQLEAENHALADHLRLLHNMKSVHARKSDVWLELPF